MHVPVYNVEVMRRLKELSFWQGRPFEQAIGANTRSSPIREIRKAAGGPVAKSEGEVKIATYNVNGVNGRLPVLLRWLKQAKPDIVCLQELKAPQERFPGTEIEKAGYGSIWHGQKSWNG